MKTSLLLAVAACAGFLVAPLTNAQLHELEKAQAAAKAATNAPIALAAPSGPLKLQSAEPGAHKAAPKVSAPVSTTDTNAILNSPLVQAELRKAFSEGAQFGISAAVQNPTLVSMKDVAGLYRAAVFMRFGAQK